MAAKPKKTAAKKASARKGPAGKAPPEPDTSKDLSLDDLEKVTGGVTLKPAPGTALVTADIVCFR